MDYNDFYRIIKEKEKNRDAVAKLEGDLSVFLYAAIMRKSTWGEISKGISETIREAIKNPPKPLISAVMANCKAVWRKGNAPSDKPDEAAFSAIDRSDAFGHFSKAAGEWVRDEETKAKEAVLSESLKEPPKTDKTDDLKAFLLCSRHDDCAEDHKPYQGKLYVKRWALRYPEIKEYCESNGIKTAEWVVGKPVWMTTRPNCRHFFTEITWGEAKSKSTAWMLKEHGMDRVVGTRSTQQNIKHSTKKEWYTEQNILRMIKRYKERLAKHQRMAEIATNENLRNAIAKDRQMIRKWEQYLAKIRMKAA